MIKIGTIHISSNFLDFGLQASTMEKLPGSAPMGRWGPVVMSVVVGSNVVHVPPTVFISVLENWIM